ncbi:MAG: type II toxin-antitoxin system HicA family toxin [Micromonosporaceae bacterium]|nr:type II toxin-antitoxin system HicA family toxin [Micromonosporaceae bacterium]
MTGRQAITKILACGGTEVRRRGSHRVFVATTGEVSAQTVVPDHGGRDLGAGLLRAIERQMEPVFGKGWLR